jgi:hypothetical protein
MMDAGRTRRAARTMVELDVVGSLPKAAVLLYSAKFSSESCAGVVAASTAARDGAGGEGGGGRVAGVRGRDLVEARVEAGAALAPPGRGRAFADLARRRALEEGIVIGHSAPSRQVDAGVLIRAVEAPTSGRRDLEASCRPPRGEGCGSGPLIED